MEKFNPSIIVHNGEGLTLTLVPNEKVFDTTKDDLDYEFKFNNLDIDSNNEVKYVNGEEGREKIKNEVFLGSKQPEILLPLDGTNDWDGILKYNVNAKPSNVERVIYTISDSSDFSSNIIETEIDKRGTKHVTSIDKLFERYGPDTEIYMRIKVILINKISLYSSTVRTRTVRVKVEILEPQEGTELIVQSKVKVTTNLPENQLKNYQYKLIFRSLSNSDYVVPVTDIKNITVDFKTIIKHFGSDVEVTTRFEILKNSILVTYDENRNRTPARVYVYTVVELVNHLNSGEQPERLDTSGIYDMSYFWTMLTDETRARDLSGMSLWDVSNVTNMEYCFGSYDSETTPHGLKSYLRYSRNDFNIDISDWDVSNVSDFSYMFYKCENFNQPLSKWKTTSASNMKGMFQNASAFDQYINTWSVGGVYDMSYMFNSAYSFKQSLSMWNVSNVSNFEWMFSDNVPFNGDVTTWDTSSATNMSNMFNYAYAFDRDISHWNVDNVTSWTDIFDLCPIQPQHKPPKFRYIL